MLAKGEVAAQKVQGSIERAANGATAEGREDEGPPSRRRNNVPARTAAVWRGSRVGASQVHGLRDSRYTMNEQMILGRELTGSALKHTRHGERRLSGRQVEHRFQVLQPGTGCRRAAVTCSVCTGRHT